MGKRDYSIKFGHAELSEFLHEFQNESDRTTAILGAAFLDDLLGQLLYKKLIDEKKVKDELLKNPLGSFHSRIICAYGFGLISKDEYNDLLNIKSIRNDFAHKVLSINFTNENISTRCNNLNLPKLMYEKLPELDQRSARDRFIQSVAMLITFLEKRRAGTKKADVPAKFKIILSDSP